jgi:hypothetical protein
MSEGKEGRGGSAAAGWAVIRRSWAARRVASGFRASLLSQSKLGASNVATIYWR